ncbi:MAG: NUDIX domain-containing protein [Hydrogenimonas sp.]|nr:NUDIX domain-containing protein [Hydrogenimonas sp.]
MKESAGIIPSKKESGSLKVYLLHMGGPYWKNKKRSWSIAKGEIEEGEEPLEAAKREFFEETGKKIEGEFIPLGSLKSSGKVVTAWAVEASPDTDISSNLFEIEWPPNSGKKMNFPEVDKAEWFDIDEAKKIITAYQIPLLKRLERL